ncbi:MAG: hypothetical protein K2H01_10535 [Ruminococcus sp.]|nr:hypothetical protein [Ruminococcus sp.]
MSSTGKNISIAVGVYVIIKALLNLILGFSFVNVLMLVVAGVIFVLLYKRMPYCNYIVAVYLALVFIAHFWTNITNLSNGFVYWIYLAEGILDLLAGALLAFNKDVKAYFSNN